MNGPLFFIFAICIIAIAFELLALDQAVQEQHFGEADFLNLSAFVIHMIMLNVFCQYSEKFTDRSYEVADMVYTEIFWYKLSIAQQKSLIFMIHRAQKQFRLKGYGIFDCSLDLFSKVFNK